MNNLESFIKNYTIKDIQKIEENKDHQFISLKKTWESVENKNTTKKTNFLFYIIQNALISFQLSWKWENRWEEFWEYIKDNQKFLENYNSSFFNNILNNWKNNRRFIDKKMLRIDKSLNSRQKLDNIDKMYYFYKNMNELNKLLAKTMNQKENAKTIVFSTKMFWYGARIIFDEFISYPFELNIPIDSRIWKIYQQEKNIENYKFKEVKEFFEKISQENNIPLLHLDSLLWIEYRYNNI